MMIQPFNGILLINYKEQTPDETQMSINLNMLNKRNQIQKSTFCMTSFILNSGRGKAIGQKSDQWLLARVEIGKKGCL